MSINIPIYIQENINETPLLKLFVSSENIKILIDVINNYSITHKLALNIQDEKTTKIVMSIINSIVVDIVNKYIDNNQLNENKLNIRKELLKLNKELLTHIISFLKKHGNNIDVFQTYFNELTTKNKIKEHKLIEKQVLSHPYYETTQGDNNQHNNNDNNKSDIISGLKTKHNNLFNSSLLDNLITEVMTNKELYNSSSNIDNNIPNITHSNIDNITVYNTIKKINTHTTPINNAINSLVYLMNNDIIDNDVKEITKDIVTYLKMLIV
jgi:hypothetical protein